MPLLTHSKYVLGGCNYQHILNTYQINAFINTFWIGIELMPLLTHFKYVLDECLY